MPDISAITAIVGSVKAATDIAKLIKESDFSLEKAELKLKLADLISTLADVRIHVVEINDIVNSKEARIKELEDAFELKDKLIKRYDAYYQVNDSEEPSGEPYCMSCWQIKHKAYLLHLAPGDRFTKICPACNRSYSSRLVETIYP